MTYDYDQHTASGEQHLATAGELEDAGFTVYDAPEQNPADPAELDYLFDGEPDLETREGVERALGRATHPELL
jgi:hypothetical protein